MFNKQDHILQETCWHHWEAGWTHSIGKLQCHPGHKETKSKDAPDRTQHPSDESGIQNQSDQEVDCIGDDEADNQIFSGWHVLLAAKHDCLKVTYHGILDDGPAFQSTKGCQLKSTLHKKQATKEQPSQMTIQAHSKSKLDLAVMESDGASSPMSMLKKEAAANDKLSSAALPMVGARNPSSM